MAVVSPHSAASVDAERSGAPLESRFRIADLGDVAYLLYFVLPRRALLEVGRVRGWADYLLRGKMRRAVRRNVKDLVPTAGTWQIETYTRRVFEYHHMRSLLLLLGPLMAARGDLAHLVPIDGVEHLERARAEGRPTMMLAAHVNSVGALLALMLLRQRGIDARVAFVVPHDAWARTHVRQFIDRRFGAATIGQATGAFYGQFNIRPLVQAIKDGATVLLVGDGWHSASFTTVPFLGRMLPFTTGPLGVARLTGATVFPLFVYGAAARLRASILPGFQIASARLDPTDLERKTLDFARMVDQHVLAHVSSWQHLLIPNVFETMGSLQDLSIAERYAL